MARSEAGGGYVITSYNGASRFVSSIKPFSPFAVGAQSLTCAFYNSAPGTSTLNHDVYRSRNKAASNADTLSRVRQPVNRTRCKIMNFPDIGIERALYDHCPFCIY